MTVLQEFNIKVKITKMKKMSSMLKRIGKTKTIQTTKITKVEIKMNIYGLNKISMKMNQNICRRT